MPLFESVQFHISSCVPPERQEQLLHVLKSNGGNEANSLDEATHVITTSNRFEGWQEAGENVSVVTDKWVDRSLVLGKLQLPEHYSADPSMLFSGVVACATELPVTDLEVLSAGITALGGQWRTGLTKDVTHLFALSPTSQKYATALHFREHTRVKILLPHWFDDAVRLGNGNLVVAPYEWPDPPLLKGTTGDDDPKGKKPKHDTEPDAMKRSIYATATTYTPTAGEPSLPKNLPLSAKPVWAGRRILLSRSLQLFAGRREAVEVGITRGGGQVVRYSGDDENLDEEQDSKGKKPRLREKQLKEEEAGAIDQCDILVTRWRGGKAYKRALDTSKTIGSLAWLFHVQHTGVLSRPLDQLLHYPIPKRPIEGFAAHEITLTNYTGEAREYLKKLITAMGATFTPSMTAKNTVLIAAFQSGTKATKAASWSLPVVNHTWLEDCFVQWRMLTVALEKYIVFPPGVDFSSLLGERGLGARAVELMDEDLVDSDNEVDNEDVVIVPVGTENSARDANEVEGLVEGLFDQDIVMQDDGDVDDSMAIPGYPAGSEQGIDDTDLPAPKGRQIVKTPTKPASKAAFASPVVYKSKTKSKSSVKTQSKSTSNTRGVPLPASSSEEDDKIELPPARIRSTSFKGAELKSPNTRQSTQARPAAQEEEEEEEEEEEKEVVVQVKSGRPKPMPKENKKTPQRLVRRKPQGSKGLVIGDEDNADDAVESEEDRMAVDSDGAANGENAASDQDSEPPPRAKMTSSVKVKPKPITNSRKDKPQAKNRKQAQVNDQQPSNSEPEIIEPRKKLVRRVTREDLNVNNVDQDNGRDSDEVSPKNTKSSTSKKPTGLLKATKGDARTRVKKKSMRGQEIPSSEEDNAAEEDNDSEVEISVRATGKGKIKAKPIASRKTAKVSDHEELSTRQTKKRASRTQPESSDDDAELPTSVLASKPRTTRSATHVEKISPAAKPTTKRVVSVLMPSLRLSSKVSPNSSPPKGTNENGAIDEESPTKRLTRMESIRIAAGEQASHPTPTPVASGSGRKVSSPSKPKPKTKVKVAEPSPTPSTNSVVPARRSAATKAEKKLRDEVMPDVMNYQQEMRKARRSGGGMSGFTPREEIITSTQGRRKRLSLATDASEKDEDDDDERAKKRRKVGVVSNGKEKGKKPVGSEEEEGTGTGTVTMTRKIKAKKVVTIDISEPEEEDKDNAESEPSPPAKNKDNGKAIRGATDKSSKSAKPSKKVTFPMLMTTQVNLSEDVQKTLIKLGVKFTGRTAECTHLLAPHLVRTEKFLCALANAPYILTEKWALDSVAAKRLLPEEDYLLRDEAGEKKYAFKLSEAIERARVSNGKVFAKMTFYVTPKVPVDVKLLKNVVSAGGGQVTTQTPTTRVLASSTDRYVISCPEDISIWRPIATNDYAIFTQELILNGALKQEIDWDNESFRVPDSVM